MENNEETREHARDPRWMPVVYNHLWLDMDNLGLKYTHCFLCDATVPLEFFLSQTCRKGEKRSYNDSFGSVRSNRGPLSAIPDSCDRHDKPCFCYLSLFSYFSTLSFSTPLAYVHFIFWLQRYLGVTSGVYTRKAPFTGNNTFSLLVFI